MAPQKETLMVLKVDLDCYRCYTKVKRTLCCYPQIQDQIYNEKQNTVTIKVVCCTPEKIRDKILAKAGKSIKGIQILELKKPAEKPVEKPAEKPASKPKEEDKPQKQAQAPPPAEKPKDASPKPPADNKPPEMKKNGSKNGGPAPAAAAKPDGPAPAAAKPKDEEGGAPKKKPAEQAAMVHMMHPSEMIQCYPGYPINAGYQGNGYGYGYGFGAPPPPPPPVQDGGWGYYGGGAPNGHGYGYGYEYNKPPANGYGDYISDENPTGCVVM